MTKRGKSQPPEQAGLTRRSLFKAGAASLTALGTRDANAAPRPAAQRSRIAVVGAGAFGGWTALYLLRQGAHVTLFDAWGPGNSRASSGGATRVIQSHLYAQGRMYGKRETYQSVYMDMVAQAVPLWQENEKRWKRPLYRRCGSINLRQQDDQNSRDAMASMHAVGLRVEALTPAELNKRYSHMNTEGVDWALYEPDAGYLRAQFACQEVLRGFQEEGGEYRQLSASAPDTSKGPISSLALADGSSIEADQYVFACGPWLGKLFPDVVRVRALRQESFVFGTPPGDERFLDDNMPTWLDGTVTPGHLGVPASTWHGINIEGGGPVKIIDPTSEPRITTPEIAAANLEYLEFRFPAMKRAPLLGSRVCQFENSLDKNFIIDRHPQSNNVWIVGGGSGHGFKHGPAVGTRAAKMILGDAPVEKVFSLARF